MDHPWRHPPPPPIPGNNNINNNICPICSIPHFPFCPPPPPSPFFQNPRFNYPPPPFHHPPPFDPHLPHPNSYPNHSDHRRPNWHGSSNPTFNMNLYNNNNHNHNNSQSVGYDCYYDNGGVKRMKVESFENVRASSGEIGIGGFPSDSERILKLIHDHGNAAAADAARRGPVNFGSEVFSEDVGLKRRREAMEMGYYDQRFELGQHGSQPAGGDAMHSSHHNLLLSRRNGEVDNHVSQQPYNWSEAKGYYGYGYGSQPPLPASPPPPPPPPMDVPRNHFFKPLESQPPPPPPPKKPSLFPVAGSSSVDSSLGAVVLENQSSAPVYYANNVSRHASSVSSAEEFHARQSSTEKHARDIQPFPLRHLSLEKQNIVDGSHIFKQPHRASRPDHFVIILRGLPGSGKSYLAKMLRDIEVEHGGEAPRIHSMDEYFMIEVEKEEDSELSKSSGSFRGKRQVMKTVMEYCYEPELEEAYRASMLKAFKKTLDEGVYSFIIVDDRNLRVADFAQFWATAKRSGYEVYLVEASYKDPAGCAARNVHNFTLPDIQKMAGQWEEAPSLYMKMDIKSLLHGDGFDESDIQEVDMDMEDDDAIDASQGPDIKRPHDETKDQVDDFRPHDDLKDATVTNHKAEEVKDLSRSKWSNDFDADEEGDGMNKNSVGALSGLAQAYSNKEAKSVCWGDQGGNVGFSISATRKTNTRSLVIGPGPGYNLKSNPLSEQDYLNPVHNAVASKTQNVFQERIRAEHESFKAVFDKRRHRIGVFNMDEE